MPRLGGTQDVAQADRFMVRTPLQLLPRLPCSYPPYHRSQEHWRAQVFLTGSQLPQ